MGFLDRILPDDRKVAATKFEGPESASARKTRVERTATRKSRARGADTAARAGQAWEDKDRQREYRRFW